MTEHQAKPTRVRRNFVFLVASNLLAPLFSVLLVLAISRLRGVEDLGRYSLLMTVFVLGQTVAGFGLQLVVTREVAQRHDLAGRYFSTACLVTAAFMLPIVAVASPLLFGATADHELALAIVLVLLGLLITSINVHGEAVLLAFERVQDFVVINLVETILRAIVGLALVLAGHGLVAIATALLVLRAVAALVYVATLRRCGVAMALHPDRALARQLIGHIPTVGMIPIVNSLYSRADVLLLTWLGTWTDVGIYSAAMRFIDLARTIPPSYGRALYPVLARLRTSSPDEYRTVMINGLRTILMMTVPITLVLFGAGGTILTLLYGPKLAPAVPSLQVLAWTLVPLAIAIVLAQVLFSADRQVLDLRTNVVASITTLVCNLLLIPRLGALGAAVSTLVAATTYAAFQYHWTKRFVIDPAAAGDIGKILGTAGASALLIDALTPANVWLATAVGLAVYGAAMVLFGFVQLDRLWRVARLAPSVSEPPR